ncbi:5998_t:CDS:2, partial [Diversispora eburnea]
MLQLLKPMTTNSPTITSTKATTVTESPKSVYWANLLLLG